MIFSTFTMEMRPAWADKTSRLFAADNIRSAFCCPGRKKAPRHLPGDLGNLGDVISEARHRVASPPVTVADRLTSLQSGPASPTMPGFLPGNRLRSTGRLA